MATFSEGITLVGKVTGEEFQAFKIYLPEDPTF